MKKIIILLLLFSMITGPVYGVNIFEKVLYKKDTLKMYGASILVDPLTGQPRYVWHRDPSGKGGSWTPLVGLMQMQYKAIYDQQNKQK